MSQDQQCFVINTRFEDLNVRYIALDVVGKGSKKKTEKRNLDSLGLIEAWRGISNNKYSIKRRKGQMELPDAFAKVSRKDQSQRNKKKWKLMANIMDLAPKAAQKLLIKGGECNKLYVPELNAITFWFFYTEVTG